MCHRTGLLAALASDLSEIELTEPIAEARANSLMGSLVKKWIPEVGGDRAPDDKALAKFLDCNESCRTFRIVPDSDFRSRVLGEVKLFLDKAFVESDQSSTLDLSAIFCGIGLGPGASVGCRDTSFYTKLFASPLTHTEPCLVQYYELYASYSPTWKEAEHNRSAQFGTMLVEASNLSFVPKTSEISRTICTEPTLNMLFQKGIGSVLERILKRHFSICLSIQPDVNRCLAQIGSLSGTFGTIDLSSASDTIGYEVVKELLPKHAFRWFDKARCKKTKLPSGEIVDLHMISSMGNGFTFPLQTLIFAAIVRAVYRLKGIPLARLNGKSLPNFGVFGDDIIVCREAYDDVVDALHMFGFTVNKDKSFNTGYFRESCGGDYVCGHDVRGVYIKTLATFQDVYSAFNRLTAWVDKTGIPIRRTLQYLLDLLPPALRLPVPYASNDDTGLKVSREMAVAVFASNRNVALRTTTKELRPFWKQKRLQRYAQLEREPFKIRVKATYCGLDLNYEGALITFVAGYIRNGYITLREERYKPSVRLRSAKIWYDLSSPDVDAVIKQTGITKLPVAAFTRDVTWEGLIDLRLTTVEPGSV